MKKFCIYFWIKKGRGGMSYKKSILQRWLVERYQGIFVLIRDPYSQS